MAKRRSVRKKNSRKSASLGGGGTWKKSNGVAGLLIIMIIGMWVYMASSCLSPNRPQAPDIPNYPFQFMVEGKGKKPFEIRADYNDKKRKKAPFIVEKGSDKGEIAWEAWTCKNPKCLYLRKYKKPFIFPRVVKYYKKRHKEGKPFHHTKEELKAMEEKGQMFFQDEMMMGDMVSCPVCKKYKKESSHAEPYRTPEGQRLLDERRKKIKERSKNN